MVSGLLSAKTVAHRSIAVVTASFEHAIAVCTETPVFNTSTTALIVRTGCIISSLISSATIARPEQAVFTFGRWGTVAAQVQRQGNYSITSSASASSLSGTGSLSAFAVLRLMHSSNLVGC